MIITIRDVRAVRYCSRGARDFFKRHGLDWADFLMNGIEDVKLLSTGDPMARKVVEVARERR